jgi:hypothetical protein
MTQNLQQPIDDFAQWTDGGDIFFRPQDKKQFQRSLKAITADRLGLAVVADNEKSSITTVGSLFHDCVPRRISVWKFSRLVIRTLYLSALIK